jgi:putative transposase
VASKRQWIDWNNPSLSIRDQCLLLGLHRSNLHYEPLRASEDKLGIMRMIDEEYTRHPAKAQRQMVAYSDRQNLPVNRKKVQRLMRIMDLEAIAPNPRNTIASRKIKSTPTCYAA